MAMEWLDKLELNVLDGQGPGTSGRKFNAQRDDPESAMMAAARKLYESNIYEGMNPEWVGVCLSVLQGGQTVGNNYEADSHIDKRFNIPGSENDAPGVIAIKVMIPELDAHLPTPKELGDHPGPHQAIIKMYPTYYSVDPGFQTSPVVGQLVRVSFGNIKTRTDCRYMGPYGGLILAIPPATTAAKCACDVLPEMGVASPEGTPYQGSNIAVNHMGHPKIPRAHGQAAGRWVVFGGSQIGSPATASPDLFVASAFVAARNSAGMNGGIYMGKLSSNGAKDYVHRDAVGRNTFFYFSKNVDTDKPLKVIVFFHGRDGFNSAEFDIIMPALKKLENNGENFVFVYPEMPYSAPDISDELKIIGHVDSKLRSRYSNFWNDNLKMWGGLDTPTGTDFDLFGEECRGIIAKMLSKHAGQNKVTISGQNVTFIGNTFGYGTKALTDTVEHTSFFSLSNSLYPVPANGAATYPKVKFVNPSFTELKSLSDTQCGSTPAGVSMTPAWPFKVLLSVAKKGTTPAPVSNSAPQGDAIMEWWPSFKKKNPSCANMLEIQDDQTPVAGRNDYWINKAIVGDSIPEEPSEPASPGPMTPNTENPEEGASSPEPSDSDAIPQPRVQVNNDCADLSEESFVGEPSTIGFNVKYNWNQVNKSLPKGKKVEDYLKVGSAKNVTTSASDQVPENDGGPLLYDNIARTCATAVVVEEYWKSIFGDKTKLVWTSTLRSETEGDKAGNHQIGAGMDFYIKLPKNIDYERFKNIKGARPSGILPVWLQFFGMEILIRAGRLPKGGLGMYLNGWRDTDQEGNPLISHPKKAVAFPKGKKGIAPGASGGNVHYDWRSSAGWKKKSSRWIWMDWNNDNTPKGETEGSKFNYYTSLRSKFKENFPEFDALFFDKEHDHYWEKKMIVPPNHIYGNNNNGSLGDGEVEISPKVPNLNQVLNGKFEHPEA